MSKAETTTTEPISGVRDLRSTLEWYRDGKSRGPEGIPIQIAGVWSAIVGRTYRANNEVKADDIDDVLENLWENRAAFPENDDSLTIEDIDRVISLLEGLKAVESDYRYYREDRERESKYDVRTQCWVGLYHVTDKTTIVTHLHKSPGMGHTMHNATGLGSPRRDVDEYLQDEVFYSKYDMTQIED
jgi:hypothetical protein